VSRSIPGSPALSETVANVQRAIEEVIVGKSQTVRICLMAFLSKGHLLIEDVPGVGKTTLAKALAKSISGVFSRIQFTPDLLPSDITGCSIFDQKQGEFRFHPGPVFGNVVLVDEINRATPKTQASLLEAMEEHQVTADGITHKLPEPFFVVATQNSVEMTGTFPLPEAQLDRFFASVSMGYPNRASEINVLKTHQFKLPIDDARQVIDISQLLVLQSAVTRVHVSDAIKGYIVDIVRATREAPTLSMGSSPRGSLYLMRAAQALALMDNVEFAKPEHVQEAAPYVLAHRVMFRRSFGESEETAADAIKAILRQVPVPV
jgi:MoxR-like ATPase